MFNKSTSFQYEKTLKACGKGQKNALQGLYKHDAGHMLALAFRVLGNMNYAEQAIQSTFITIWKNADTYEEEAGPAKGWIYSILRFRIGVLYKQHYDSIQAAAQNTDPLLSETFINLQADIHDAEESHSVFYGYLDELPVEPQRALINMYFSASEQAGTATFLNMPLGRFKENILLGLRHLSKKLDSFPHHAENEKIGEYVLGGLSGEEERYILQLFNRDSSAANIALIWEAHFTEFLDQLPQQTPPQRLWDSIRHNLKGTEESGNIPDAVGEHPVSTVIPGHIKEACLRLWGNVKFWQLCSLALALLTAVLVIMMPSSSNMPKMIAIMSDPAQNIQTAWVIKINQDGSAQFKPLIQQNIAENLEMEVWTQSSASGNDYRSLGTIKSSTPFNLQAETLGKTNPGQLFQISLEPVGGSKSNKPSGSVLYQGRLVDVSN